MVDDGCAILCPMSKLLIRKSIGPPIEMTLTAERYLLGRAADNDIVLEGSGVSRRHCVLERQPDGYRVVDSGSHNGIYVNGARIQSAQLQPNDQIRVGNNVLVYAPNKDVVVEPRSVISSTVTFEQDYESVVASLRKGTRPSSGHARPIADLEDDRQTLQLLCDLALALSTVHSLEDVSRKALEFLLETSRAERSAIFLLEGSPSALRPVMVCDRENTSPAPPPVALSSTVAYRILTERKGIVAADAATDPRFAHGQSVVLYGLRSIACAPLIGKEGALGILYIENNRAVGAFALQDLLLLCAVASQIGLS